MMSGCTGLMPSYRKHTGTVHSQVDYRCMGESVEELCRLYIWSIRTIDDSVQKSFSAVAFPKILMTWAWVGDKMSCLSSLQLTFFLLDLSSYCLHPVHLVHVTNGPLIY